MKTKTTIAFALLWVAATSLAAQTGKFPFPADVRFCWAPSGLNIRAEGNAEGYILSKIPYGAAVVLRDGRGERMEFLVIEELRLSPPVESSDYYMEGEWVEVSYNGTIGWVFGGYLGKLPPLVLNEEKYASEGFDEYINRLFTPTYRDTIRYTGENNQIRVFFENGAFIETSSSVGGTTQWCIIPDLEIHHFVSILLHKLRYSHENLDAGYYVSVRDREVAVLTQDGGASMRYYFQQHGSLLLIYTTIYC